MQKGMTKENINIFLKLIKKMLNNISTLKV